MPLFRFLNSLLALNYRAVLRHGGLALLFTSSAMAAASSASPAIPAPMPGNIRFETLFGPTHSLARQLGTINSFAEDHQGFMWMAGDYGLSRYDGRNLRIYKANPSSSRSIPPGVVRRLIVDKDGVLWIAAEHGLARYHLETDDFTQITAVGSKELVRSLPVFALGADNSLYVGVSHRLYVINPDRSSMTEHAFQIPVERPSDREELRDMDIDAQGRVWISTAGAGIAIFDPDSATFEYLTNSTRDPSLPRYDNLITLAHDPKGNVWLGTFGYGITRFNPTTGEFKTFLADENGLGSLKSNVIWDIKSDSEGAIWAATDNAGLAYFDETTQTFHHYLHEPQLPFSLISNQLRVVYEDNKQNLWLSAFPSGVSFYNRSTRIFRHYVSHPEDPESLSHSSILSFAQTEDGTIWVGTEGGLNGLDPVTGKFRRFVSVPADPKALKANPVLAIEEDKDGFLWVGTWAGGLHRFYPETGNFYRFPFESQEPDNFNSAFVWSIVRDKEDTIWIGTETGGLNRFNRHTGDFTAFLHSPENQDGLSGNFAYKVIADSRGKLWIGTFTGLNIMDKNTERFFRVPYATGEANATRSKNIKSLFEDSRGLIWIGHHQQGLDIYNPETGLYQHLDMEDGLPSPTISSILEDNNGDIWVATANGLAKISYPQLSIRVLGLEDGLMGANFHRDASLVDKTGRLYFGSTQGITSFHPTDLDQRQNDFSVWITNFRILNREVPIAAEGSPLQRSIVVTDHIQLAHTDVMFAFDFTALDYRNAASLQYSYKLEGFDQDWVEIGNSATATYTNIQPGRYVFRVRASVVPEQWVEGQSIVIEIKPPLWRTWWAYCFYVAIGLAVLYYRHEFVKLRIRAEVYRSKSVTDPLTGIYNRLGIAQVAEGMFANAETRKGACLMLFDIDHFKRVNDRRGHDAGDRTILAVTAIIRNCVRNSDHFGRWGGEEFILLCATDNAESSRNLAEKIRAAVENNVYEKDTTPLRVTVSIGVTDIKVTDTLDSAVKRADMALYRAKSLGRNCVVVADSD